ncbi:hypothetical protein HNO52_00970 [Billgrantia diversa]|uniref:DUF4870 family protein n=1 Tax=Halomonas sp. MCCC 1A13316 TaxID=2733487 RepID=UPI0018A4C9D6|nr:hypothetical protein [Halomonas sp. MCCC 1A13316]QOR37230.1 hypothetical protein HNO52_00970 [Halomonas sp. MCCC 1A13316]
MTSNTATFPPSAAQSDERGTKLAAVIYVLFLGSIMAVVTAPAGVLVAHLRRRHVADWVATHLQFQIRTFWLGIVGAGICLAAWQLLGVVGAPTWAPWTLGYVFFTACLIWMVGRCGVGIHRLMAGRAIDAPRSLWLGGAHVSLHD